MLCILEVESPLQSYTLPLMCSPSVGRLTEVDPIRSTSGVNPSSSLVETIYGRTEGNPLFVTEVIRMLDHEGGVENQEQLASIPEGVRDAIGRRLNGVSEGCNQVLTTVSIIGREFDFKLLRALSEDIGEAKLLEFVDEARQAHLLEELSGGRYR